MMIIVITVTSEFGDPLLQREQQFFSCLTPSSFLPYSPHLPPSQFALLMPDQSTYSLFAKLLSQQLALRKKSMLKLWHILSSMHNEWYFFFYSSNIIMSVDILWSSGADIVCATLLLFSCYHYIRHGS